MVRRTGLLAVVALVAVITLGACDPVNPPVVGPRTEGPVTFGPDPGPNVVATASEGANRAVVWGDADDDLRLDRFNDSTTPAGAAPVTISNETASSGSSLVWSTAAVSLGNGFALIAADKTLDRPVRLLRGGEDDRPAQPRQREGAAQRRVAVEPDLVRGSAVPRPLEDVARVERHDLPAGEGLPRLHAAVHRVHRWRGDRTGQPRRGHRRGARQRRRRLPRGVRDDERRRQPGRPGPAAEQHRRSRRHGGDGGRGRRGPVRPGRGRLRLGLPRRVEVHRQRARPGPSHDPVRRRARHLTGAGERRRAAPARPRRRRGGFVVRGVVGRLRERHRRRRFEGPAQRCAGEQLRQHPRGRARRPVRGPGDPGGRQHRLPHVVRREASTSPASSTPTGSRSARRSARRARRSPRPASTSPPATASTS